MNTHFITLPSGLRINTAHIIHYGQSEHVGQVKLVLTDEPTPWLETLSLEQLDSMLNPPQSPIVSPVIDLDRLKPGAACQFNPHEAKSKHGVIERIEVTDYGDIAIRVTSDGERHTMLIPAL